MVTKLLSTTIPPLVVVLDCEAVVCLLTTTCHECVHTASRNWYAVKVRFALRCSSCVLQCYWICFSLDSVELTLMIAVASHRLLFN